MCWLISIVCLEKRTLTLKRDEYVDNNKDVFKDLKPMPGGIEAFEFLSKHFETYILTTAPWKNISSWSEKREWVGKYLPDLGEKKV